MGSLFLVPRLSPASLRKLSFRLPTELVAEALRTWLIVPSTGGYEELHSSHSAAKILQDVLGLKKEGQYDNVITMV